jgi:hypothetical protein
MTKKDILDAIKRTAKENNGVGLGMEKFFESTGIKRTDWEGKHWIRWADAIKEAGFTPNTFSTPAFDMDWLLAQFADYIKYLNHYPTQPELKIKNHNDKKFPSLTTMKSRLGNKTETLEKLIEFCKTKSEYKEVLEICETELDGYKPNSAKDKIVEGELGVVYLMKSGKHYKIGKATHTGNRHYQLSIQLPEKVSLVHEIQTDDPFGIEKYWHGRFQDKRLNGEWFELTPSDIAAFKRRKFM